MPPLSRDYDGEPRRVVASAGTLGIAGNAGLVECLDDKRASSLQRD